MSDKNIDWLKRLQLLEKALEKNGVEPGVWVELETKISGYELDFSEHDKVFEDKIAELDEKYLHMIKTAEKHQDKRMFYERENKELKQRIAELESKETENISEIDTSSPLACAESLIEHMTHCEKFMIMPERDVQTFSVEELKEIADYLMVYYKHHRDRDNEPIAF